MPSKQMVVNFPESTQQNRSQTVTIPNLKSVLNVAVNTGSVTYTANGDQVTINVSGGSPVRYTTSNYTPSKTVSDSRTSSTNSFPSTISYNDGIYSGTLSKSGSATSTVVSGSPPASKTATGTRTSQGDSSEGCPMAQSSATAGLPTSIPYSDSAGYTGTLSRTSSSVGSCSRSGTNSDNWQWFATATGNYSGTVSKPDTRQYNYTQAYSGTVYGPAQTSYTYYYAYTATVTYEDNLGQTLTLTLPVNGVQLSEGKTYKIEGTTLDGDVGDIVTLYYRVDGGTMYQIKQASSDGQTAIPFTLTLTFTQGVLKAGTTTVSTQLEENATHLLEVWSEDNKGGYSITAQRTFTVTLDRPPTLTETFNATNANLGDDSPITINGTVSDPEGNTVTMSYRLNGGSSIPVPISSGAWSIQLTPKQLKAGTNSLVLTAADQYGASTVRTFTLNRSGSSTPLKVAHARYKLKQQTATAREALAWLQYENGDLTVDGALSVVDTAAAESFQDMTKTTSNISADIIEAQFIGTRTTGEEKLTLRLTLTAADANSTTATVNLTGAIKE